MTETVNMTETRKERDSNFELLRIVCILFIILHHVLLYAHWDMEAIQSNQAFHSLFIFLEFFGKAGVSIFVVITGYFLVKSKDIKLEKMVRLWLEVFFYSVIISAIFAIANGATYSPYDMFRIVTPVISQTWWFVTPYFVVLMASPFMNMTIDRVGRKWHLWICIALITVICVAPIFTGRDPDLRQFPWFILLYMIGAYIGNTKKEESWSPRTNLFLLIIGLSVFAAIALLYAYVGPDNELLRGYFGNRGLFYYPNGRFCILDNNLAVLLVTVALFLVFKDIKVKNNGIVNTMAMTVFGIYLIHEQPQVRIWLYDTMIPCNQFSDPIQIIGVIVAAVLGILIACTIAEFVRLRVFELVERKLKHQ